MFNGESLAFSLFMDHFDLPQPDFCLPQTFI